MKDSHHLGSRENSISINIRKWYIRLRSHDCLIDFPPNETYVGTMYRLRRRRNCEIERETKINRGWWNEKGCACSCWKIGSALIEGSRECDRGCDEGGGSLFRREVPRGREKRCTSSRRRKRGGCEEGGYPNFLLHLADGCLNPEIASASFKIIRQCVPALIVRLSCPI